MLASYIEASQTDPRLVFHVEGSGLTSRDHPRGLQFRLIHGNGSVVSTIGSHDASLIIHEKFHVY